MSRRGESTLAEGIGGLFLFGIFLIIEYWKVICLVIICLAVFIGAIALIVQYFRNKDETNNYLNSYNQYQHNQNLTEQVPEQNLTTTHDTQAKNISVSDNHEIESSSVYPVVKIDIATCSYDDMVSLGILNKATVSRIIKERDNGSMWYNMDSFAGSFNLQPHEIIEMQELLVFPKEPVKLVKTGRRVEW